MYCIHNSNWIYVSTRPVPFTAFHWTAFFVRSSEDSPQSYWQNLPPFHGFGICGRPSHSNSMTMVREFRSTTTPIMVSNFSSTNNQPTNQKSWESRVIKGLFKGSLTFPQHTKATNPKPTRWPSIACDVFFPKRRIQMMFHVFYVFVEEILAKL